MNSGHQGWRQAPFPAEPSCRSFSFFFILKHYVLRLNLVYCCRSHQSIGAQRQRFIYLLTYFEKGSRVTRAGLAKDDFEISISPTSTCWDYGVSWGFNELVVIPGRFLHAEDVFLPQLSLILLLPDAFSVTTLSLLPEPLSTRKCHFLLDTYPQAASFSSNPLSQHLKNVPRLTSAPIWLFQLPPAYWTVVP